MADFLVIGSGVAGLMYALKTADHGTVTLITKKGLPDSNTNYAQGGIASVLGGDDSFDLHFEDTIKAGANLCNEKAVRVLVENGPRMMERLVDIGVSFSSEGGSLDLGMEGGHSRRRIAHAKDLTGAKIEQALIRAVKNRDNITIHENTIGINLCTQVGESGDREVTGAYVMNRENGDITEISADSVYLATGGAGKVYLYTSNPDIASGDGIGMAYRAGATIANMEFMQFHPTCLYHPLAKSFLISEAVRGEGAVLKTSDGKSFMDRYHKLASLAPRDIVARAIDRETKIRGDDFVYLDTRMIEADWFVKRFPNIYNNCISYGFDPTKEMIPVVPAAHYICGGVQTDLYGNTDIKGLFAAGETAHTGVHGANRLASNSLLEAVVFSDRSANSAIKWVAENRGRKRGAIKPWDKGSAVADDEMVVISHMWDEIRRLMWNYVGIARTDKRLKRAKRRIDNLQNEIDEYYWHVVVTPDLVELRNLATCAKLIIESALARKESRGLHFNLDYPKTDDENYRKDTLFSKTDFKQ